jgi:sigma-54 specific flagellar transcriptional regulator A
MRHDTVLTLEPTVQPAPSIRASVSEIRKSPAPFGVDRLAGDSPEMRRLRALIEQVAPHDTSVLVTGDSGTGKEQVARAIHECSSRAEAPFVAINCGAIPEDLLESELFGHERGAFTGAIALRRGRFELAEGGTLFLDELGDMPLPMQVKLLRVIQERSFERVGGTQTLHCNVRIIAATHRDLEARIADGSFREDLYYRIAVFPLETPSLSDRIGDLPSLVNRLVERLRAQGGSGVRFDDGALAALTAYHWPGNVRELANLVERMSVVCTDGVASADMLPPRYRAEPVVTAAASGGAVIAAGPAPRAVDNQISLPEGGLDLRDHLARIEVTLIRDALARADGVVAQAAQLLRLSRTTLIEKLRKYRIQPNGSELPVDG